MQKRASLKPLASAQALATKKTSSKTVEAASRKPGSSLPSKDLRARAEESLAKTRRDVDHMPEKDMHKLVHELQVHQLELEMQNDQLRRTQQGLEAASDRYSDLYDFAPGALLTLSEQGAVLEANLSAAALLGLGRKELLHQKFTRFIPPESQGTFHLYCQQVLHSGIKQVSELTLKSATGRRLTVRVEGIATLDPETYKTQCRLSLNDITASKELEAALAAINARLDGVIASAMDAIISVDARQHIVLFNQAAEKMFGITAQKALGQSLGRFIPERYRAAHVRHVSQFGATGVSSRSMGRLGALLGLRASGEEFPIEASISQVEVQGEKLFTVILRDITERKRLDEMLRQLNAELEQRMAERTAELRDNEARYRSLVTASAQIVWTTNAQGEVLEDLPSWRAFTGQSCDEIKGWGWARALHPDDLERTKAVWQHSVTTRELYEIEYRVRRHDGEYRDFTVRGVPVKDKDGSVREWVGACTDITERKAARARREATHALLALFARKSSSKKYLEGVIEAIRAWTDCRCLGIRVVDERGAIPYGAWVGFDAEFLQVENEHSLKTDNCCCIRAMTQAIEETDRPLLTPGGSLRCDNTAEFVSRLSPQQQTRYRGGLMSAGLASAAVIPVRYHGQLLGALHLADPRPARFPLASVEFLESMAPLIGEALQRFRTEAELAKHRDELEVLVRQRTAELERSNRDLEQFANVASHDLQEPLRAVSGFVKLLQHRFPDRVDAKAAEYIKGACEGAERMERLILDLLAFSRVGTKGSEFVLVDLNTLLDDALRNLQASLKRARALVTHDPLPSLPADATQTTQLFQNLIGNAIKFRGEQPPKIHVGVRREPECWVISVRDNGIGIEPQYFERIFQLFQRLHTRKVYPGTGIGLTICKRIVERHGGTIWVESKPGRGSTFFFSMPPSSG
jgi:PAS domain S-box-containing protein